MYISIIYFYYYRVAVKILWIGIIYKNLFHVVDTQIIYSDTIV